MLSSMDHRAYLWGRVPADALEVFGDAALVTRLQTMTAL
jgi:hypothetical protein